MTTDNAALSIRRRWLKVMLWATTALLGSAVFAHAMFAPAPEVDDWISVSHQPLVHTIGLVGKIAPHKTVVISAPFDGNLQTLLVEPGQRVEQGELLLTMDPTSIETQLRDALSAQLKAQRVVQELVDWETGAQVLRARRAVRTATMTLNNVQRRVRDSELLLARGIIARNELEDLKQQLQMQELERQAAQSELDLVLDQGAGEQRRIAEMELKNATVRYEGLRSLLDDRHIVAPFTGVVMPVSATQVTGAVSSVPVQTGTRLSQGQALFAIADIEQLKIIASVSELDINQLHPGQTVEIEGDGFIGERLEGTVEIVSDLAKSAEEDAESATFAVTLSVPRLTPEQLRRIRLGMSARLSIVTYRNEQAIVVPPEAIRHEGVTKIVEYRPAIDQPGQQVSVVTGRSTVSGVEVSGLAPGFVRVQPTASISKPATDG
ncbi:efflux RND transporter periplasmic adaptor subunit [Pseudomonas sp. PB3P13]